jgi:hypothetical protein
MLKGCGCIRALPLTVRVCVCVVSLFLQAVEGSFNMHIPPLVIRHGAAGACVSCMLHVTLQLQCHLAFSLEPAIGKSKSSQQQQQQGAGQNRPRPRPARSHPRT